MVILLKTSSSCICRRFVVFSIPIGPRGLSAFSSIPVSIGPPSELPVVFALWSRAFRRGRERSLGIASDILVLCGNKAVF